MSTETQKPNNQTPESGNSKTREEILNLQIEELEKAIKEKKKERQKIRQRKAALANLAREKDRKEKLILLGLALKLLIFTKSIEKREYGQQIIDEIKRVTWKEIESDTEMTEAQRKKAEADYTKLTEAFYQILDEIDELNKQ